MKPLRKLSFILFIVLVSYISIANSNNVRTGSLGPELQQTVKCLNDYINSFQSKMRPNLFKIFQKTFPNTLTTTVQHYSLTENEEFTYIITGDIEAMWLRDSTNQFLPYLKIEAQCPHIQALAKGLINAQASFIMIDPYTNAFKKYQKDSKNRPFYLKDKTQKLIMGIPVDLCRQRQFATKAIWERKFEIDSLASFLRLAYEYHNKYNDLSIININFIRALRRLLTTLDEQIKDQIYQKQMGAHFYTFFRDFRQLPSGIIKSSSRTGMIKTGFRPSDDANELPYNIPGNAMIASYLELVAKTVLSKIQSKSVFYSTVQVLIKKMLNFEENIRLGINNYGVIEQPEGNVYAYEVDGLGKHRLYDDSNLPSLISLPYLGFVPVDNEIYSNTRKLILSHKNPYYFQKDKLKGVGSSHTQQFYIWPLAIMVQALTSTDDNEIKQCLYNLQSSAKNDLMHEAFSVMNPNMITRQWFAWANSFFGQMIVTLQKTKPNVLK